MVSDARKAAEAFVAAHANHGPSRVIEDLAALLASERAAATAACAEVADAVYHREMLAEARAGDRNTADLCRAKMEAAEEIDDAIRALPPTGTGLVVVAREDLETITESGTPVGVLREDAEL